MKTQSAKADRRTDKAKRCAWPGIDTECAELVESLNLLPGVKASSACCGHGKEPIRVCIKVSALDAASEVAGALDDTLGEWRLVALMTAGQFLLEGPPGDYETASTIAGLIEIAHEFSGPGWVR